MTGTSIDGIDAALARIDGAGLDMRVELLRHVSRPMGTLSAPLRSVAAQTSFSAGELAWYAHEFGKLHADVIGELVVGTRRRGGESLASSADLICVHGQTVFHDPPLSWQLINPSPIARRFGCPVVYDLRQADLAAGGQGAPITPIADWVLFRDAQASRAIVNLGGFCNATVLPKQSNGQNQIQRAGASRRGGSSTSCRLMSELKNVRGFDVCACNQVLDAVAREALGVHYDDEDRVASSGNVVPEAAEELRQVLMEQAGHGRSLGTGDETIAWVTRYLREMSAEDLAASAVWAVAGCIGEALEQQTVDEIYVAGGGARHRLLVQLLDQRCAAPVRDLDELGVPVEAREALCMAVLCALCADDVPITLPQVTGCASPAPVAGVWCLPGGLRDLETGGFAAEAQRARR